MATEDYKTESKKTWYSEKQETPNIEQLSFGCLQRIADATEVMAKNYNELIRERDLYKKRYENVSSENDRLRRSVASYKGKLKTAKSKNP